MNRHTCSLPARPQQTHVVDIVTGPRRPHRFPDQRRQHLATNLQRAGSNHISWKDDSNYSLKTPFPLDRKPLSSKTLVKWSINKKKLEKIIHTDHLIQVSVSKSSLHSVWLSPNNQLFNKGCEVFEPFEWSSYQINLPTVQTDGPTFHLTAIIFLNFQSMNQAHWLSFYWYFCCNNMPPLIWFISRCETDTSALFSTPRGDFAIEGNLIKWSQSAHIDQRRWIQWGPEKATSWRRRRGRRWRFYRHRSISRNRLKSAKNRTKRRIKRLCLA